MMVKACVKYARLYKTDSNPIGGKGAPFNGWSEIGQVGKSNHN